MASLEVVILSINYWYRLRLSPTHQQIFHFGTAEMKGDDTITFNAVCLGPKFDMTFEKEIWLSNASVAPGNVWQFTLNLALGKCERSKRPVDPASVEFPTVHPYRHGLPNSRYSYLMASDRKGYNLPYRDVVKVCGEECHFTPLCIISPMCFALWSSFSPLFTVMLLLYAWALFVCTMWVCIRHKHCLKLQNA